MALASSPFQLPGYIDPNLISKVKIWAVPRIYNALPAWGFPKQDLRFRAYCLGAPKLLSI